MSWEVPPLQQGMMVGEGDDVRMEQKRRIYLSSV
jgi:hypothetical protein